MCEIGKVTTMMGENIPIELYSTKRSKICQWQIRYVDLGEKDVDKRECGKVRPCLIVSSNEYNQLLDSTIAVIPLSKSPMYNCVTDTLIGFRLSDDTTVNSILCLNELQFVSRHTLQNVVCDDVSEEAKARIMKYLFNRFGMGQFISDPKIEVVEPTPVLIAETGSQQKDGGIANAIESSLTKIFTENVAALQDTYSNSMNIVSKLIDHDISLNPSNVNTKLSIIECREILTCFNISGISAFKDTPEYNEKTALAAVKRCKARIKTAAAVVVPLEDEEE